MIEEYEKKTWMKLPRKGKRNEYTLIKKGLTIDEMRG